MSLREEALRLALDPKRTLSYTGIAALLGTTRQAVSGYVFRHRNPDAWRYRDRIVLADSIEDRREARARGTLRHRLLEELADGRRRHYTGLARALSANPATVCKELCVMVEIGLVEPVLFGGARKGHYRLLDVEDDLA